MNEQPTEKKSKAVEVVAGLLGLLVAIGVIAADAPWLPDAAETIAGVVGALVAAIANLRN
ncbi:MAG: hypothetical protein AAF702_44540 [Chloroflexota bacterium]